MTFIALISVALRKLHTAIKQRRAFYELRNLSPMQLRDIGLRIENGYVVTDAEIEDAKDQRRQTLRSDQQENKT